MSVSWEKKTRGKIVVGRETHIEVQLLCVLSICLLIFYCYFGIVNL